MGGDGIDVRSLRDGELADWLRALNTGFLNEPTPTARDVAGRTEIVADSRVRGAFDAGRCVATYRSFDQQVTAVGGAPVASNAISNITVSPTHRRRGLLSRLIDLDLRAARERGDTLATLVAAEYRIYGRFGFGPATRGTEWVIDVARTGLDPRWSGPAEPGARIDLVDLADVRVIGPVLYDEFRRRQPGATNRDAMWWRRTTGELRLDSPPWKEPFYAAYRNADGAVEGLIAYRTEEKWGEGKQPLNTAVVEELVALTPAAERALWEYVCSIDWIVTVRTGMLAPDTLLPDLFPDARAARAATQGDWLWVRLLDVAAALSARTYEGTGSVVLDVVDEPQGAGGPSGGRFRLDASPQGAQCVPTTAAADLTLSLGTLAWLWLGEGSVQRLLALGRITEERPGAAAAADALFRTSRRPWCPDIF
ncbi:GNAT family N-acetyltransferase [Streptomyces sp. NPDC059816]|uniref:GNAT family N-acetyltransferase n=1 Tax=Streptomyces sp. NPDC059816 TaxID=3346960 RepID=UPI00364E7DAB